MELRFKGRKTVFTVDRIEKESEEASTFRPDTIHTDTRILWKKQLNLMKTCEGHILFQIQTE